MNKHDVQLNRLFATARLAPGGEQPAAMPARLQYRVLATWRNAPREESCAGTTTVLRAALACAAMLMLASIAWSFGELAFDPENDIAIANYELRADVMP